MGVSGTPVNWGILGTGNIARTFAKAVMSSAHGKLAGVGSRTQEAAERFGEEFQIPRRYGSYDALVKDDSIDAVYISLPNHLHAEWCIRCAQAGKQILCEKPLTVNFAQAMSVMEAVRYHGVFLMEAFMYRCHPQTARLQELIREGVIGEVRLIQSNFAYNLGPKYENIRLSNPAAGGGIMDVGCYTASMARLIAGAAVGKHVSEPVEVKGCAHIGDVSRVDEQATASLKFPGGIVANLACGCQVAIDNTLRIFGSEGNILVPNPWFPRKGDNIIIVQKPGKPAQEVIVPSEHELYSIEADTVASCVAAPPLSEEDCAARREAPSPCMTWDDSLGNMKTLDQWRRSVGLTFDEEKEEGLKQNLPRLALQSRNQQMKYGWMDEIRKPISRIVMGSMMLFSDDLPFACAMLDAYAEMGGNCIDTAYVYGGGQCERAVGKWIQLRDNREQIVLIAKGAHTPYCTVEGIDRQIEESLTRLGTDYVDLWLMHRDNEDVPVGDFIECLNEHVRKGRVRAIGASNWTTARIDAANAYAHENGLISFSASSPNLSLAVWNEPQWEGCVTASDLESLAWHQRTQIPLFAWSSQASGFFTGRFCKDDPSDSQVVRVWYNDENFRRYERAKELAQKKGVSSTQIAIAYVLCQPFPTFPLIGPQTIEELRTSLMGLDVELSAEETKWLIAY